MLDRDPISGLREAGTFATAAAAEAAHALRERALEKAHARAVQSPEDVSQLSPEAARQALRELHLHQIELELQNEELRRAQHELEASWARYFDLFDLAPVGYLTIGEKGLVLEANLTAAGLLGVVTNALVAQPWTRFIFPEDQDIYLRHNRQVLRTGTLHVCELRLLRKDGEPFWARLEARLAHGTGGARASRTVLSDITERKRAEETLRTSEARHRILFEKSRDALMTVAPPGWHFTSANAATIAMFQARDEADFLSQTPWYYSPERQADGRFSDEKGAAMMEVAMRHGCHSFEWNYRRASGEEFRATVVLARMEANGSPLLQATVRDENEAQKQRAILAQTERLASMGMLAASVGHEINNPLSYVLSNVETLAHTLPQIVDITERCCAALRTAVGDEAFAAIIGDGAALLEPAALKEANEHAQDALDGARRITRISRALNTFSRVDTPELSKVDLRYAIECAITIAANQIKLRAELVTDYGSVPAVRASEGKLSQVFLNLLVNASHAMDEAKPEGHRITIRTWAEEGHVFAEISDTGKGIAPENMGRIFEPFFSTKRIGVGSGLGLSICRNIIAEFDGDIQAKSELGQGTRFVIRLPAWAEEPEARSTEPNIEVPGLPAPHARILVVDDEAPLRKLMKRLLAGHEVVLTSSAKEAQAILDQDHDFDLILCDLMMPEVTGLDLHQWLERHNPALAERVVFITGGVFGPAAAEYLANSGNIKIDKPFDTKTFEHVVSERIRVVNRDRPRLVRPN